MSDPPQEITVLLDHIRDGQAHATSELIDLLYDQFRQRAHGRLDRERPGHSLATSDLTHETLLRLRQNDEFAKAANGNQLFRAFARAMRQVLIDHARHRNAVVHGGQRAREELDDFADHVRALSQLDLLALHESLEALANEHSREAEVLQLRFFGGYEIGEIAAILGVSPSTIERDARFGLAWLRVHLSPKADDADTA